MGLWGRVKRAVKKVVKKVAKKAKEVYEDVKEDVKEAYEEVKTTWKEAWEIVKNCTGALGCALAAVNALAKGVFETIGAVVDLGVDAFGWSLDVLVSVVGTVVGGVIVVIGALFGGKIETALDAAGSWLIDGSYTVGRVVSEFIDDVGGWIQKFIGSLLALVLLVLFLARLLYCSVVLPAISHGRSLPTPAGELAQHSTRTLEVDVIIIDKDAQTRNPISESELADRISNADRILRERARIRVKQHGPIKRSISQELYTIDASGLGNRLGEWLKGPLQLLGRDDPRHLTVYAVGSITDFEGLHQPLYGSVFIQGGNPPTTLAHEIGHALLSIDRMGHRADSTNLMHTPAKKREDAVSWPRGTPTLTEDQWCSMRQSRWVNWSWDCDRCVAVGR